MEKHLNLLNWTFCQYESEDSRAFISFGGEPTKNPHSFKELYFVTLMDKEQNTLFQKTFSTLENALKFINQAYEGWEFRDQTQQEGGCGSCQAH